MNCIVKSNLFSVFRRYIGGRGVLSIPEALPDKILGLNGVFNRDQNKNKVNLTVGIYKDAWGSVTTFPSVLAAQKIVEKSHDHDFSYLPITGHEKYREVVSRFIFDECVSKGELLEQQRISFTQSLSGTGALSTAAKFLSSFVTDKIWIPDPSWSNHTNIFEKNNFKNIHYYSYFKNGRVTVDEWLDNLRKTLKEDISTKSHAIILHACCHNPTGFDPTKEEWQQIIDTIYELNMIPIVDMAYQGLETGDLKKDAYLLRMILDENRYKSWRNGVFVCQSFAKNMGLYCERVGSLSIITPPNSGSLRKNIDSQLKRIIRSTYSSPPGYGSQIAYIVISDPKLKDQWFQDVQLMVHRLISVRKRMYEYLKWSNLINYEQQHGMFYFTGFNEEKIQFLRDKYSIYLTLDGRMSLSGINASNINYICNALQVTSKL